MNHCPYYKATPRFLAAINNNNIKIIKKHPNRSIFGPTFGG